MHFEYIYPATTVAVGLSWHPLTAATLCHSCFLKLKKKLKRIRKFLEKRLTNLTNSAHIYFVFWLISRQWLYDCVQNCSAIIIFIVLTKQTV